MCVLSIKVPMRKKSGNLFNDPCTYNRAERNLRNGHDEPISNIAFHIVPMPLRKG